MNIPPGYSLTIASYEADAKNLRNETLSGLTKEEVFLYLDFLSPFRAPHMGGLYGNISADQVPEAGKSSLMDAFRKNPHMCDLLFEEVAEALASRDAGESYARDLLNDLLGMWNEGSNYRVFHGYRVHDFRFPVEDVTKKFTLSEEE